MEMIEKNLAQALQYLTFADKTDYIGESVSQLEHALQCAYFAEQSGHSEEVILASLFHDIGHFASNTQQFQMAELGVVNHEWIGAKLAYDIGFSTKVALLIGSHVDAKRYLSAKKPVYYERLSAASKGTLAFQGGPMSEDEMKIFENHSCFKEILQVRVNDEKAKEVDLVVPDLNYYAPMIRQHFKKNFSQRPEQPSLKDFVDNAWVRELRELLIYEEMD